MAYCDYEFYKNKYFGNVITEADFPRLIDRASTKLDYLTLNNISMNDILDDELRERIQKAACSLAEKMYDIENANATIRENGGLAVSSVSSGSESISYKVDAAISEKEQNKAYYELVREYLHGTGLLYAGL